MSEKRHWVLRSPSTDTRAVDVYDGPGEYAVKMHHGYWGRIKDAYLIAAAPDLLEVARELLDSHVRMDPHHEDMCSLCMKAKAVIAKAEGER